MLEIKDEIYAVDLLNQTVNIQLEMMEDEHKITYMISVPVELWA